MLKFQIGIQACFTTVIYWSRFSSLKYRLKECHVDLILYKKRTSVFLCLIPALLQPCENLGAAKHTKWLPRPDKIRIYMFSLGYPSEEAVQESTVKTDQTVWMHRLLNIRRAL